MKNELDTHLILDVYEIVHTHGERELDLFVRKLEQLRKTYHGNKG